MADGMLNLKGEHEALRAYLRQMEGWHDGIDGALESSPEERLVLVREKISNLYYGLVHLKDGSDEHIRKDRNLLYTHLDKSVVEALEQQHRDIHRALELSIRTIEEAIPQKADIDHLRACATIVKESFFSVLKPALEHMAAEDKWIDVLANRKAAAQQ
ncbi:MAG: hypothetical protein HYX79_09200 [Chloroflexi bacterium]|nr:hypothetical protein [Chloroflexota bacterium]